MVGSQRRSPVHFRAGGMIVVVRSRLTSPGLVDEWHALDMIAQALLTA